MKIFEMIKIDYTLCSYHKGQIASLDFSAMRYKEIGTTSLSNCLATRRNFYACKAYFNHRRKS